MKKQIIVLIALVPLVAGCMGDRDPEWKGDEVEGVAVTEYAVVLEPVVVDTTAANADTVKHFNKRFRNVTVSTVGEKEFRIQGEAQAFEASISWVIEDGHNELKKGHETTSAGAPDWGKFDFTVSAEKARENSTLHLILFEGSPKDGSRQYELPLLLY